MTTCCHIPPQSVLMCCSSDERWWGRSLREASGDWCRNDGGFLPKAAASLLEICGSDWSLLRILHVFHDSSEGEDIVKGLNSLHSSQMYEERWQVCISLVSFFFIYDRSPSSAKHPPLYTKGLEKNTNEFIVTFAKLLFLDLLPLCDFKLQAWQSHWLHPRRFSFMFLWTRPQVGTRTQKPLEHFDTWFAHFDVYTHQHSGRE